jgi:hypothetical protein
VETAILPNTTANTKKRFIVIVFGGVYSLRIFDIFAFHHHESKYFKL